MSRFLCVCAGGNVRSHALAYVLKNHGHEAIAIGTDHFNDAASLLLFGEWADHILTVHPNQTSKLDRILRLHFSVRCPCSACVKHNQKINVVLKKIIELPIGHDRWGLSNCLHLELLQVCEQCIFSAFPEMKNGNPPSD